jgi:hypothetical protein
VQVLFHAAAVAVVYSLEQKNVRLRFVDFVMLPSEALRVPKSAHMAVHNSLGGSYLCNPDASPLVFPQQLQRALGGVVVVFGDSLEHRLR